MFDLKTPAPVGRPFRLGSIWERVAKDSGECYFGGYIESGVSGYVPLRIFRSKKNPNAWVIVRNLPGDRRHGAQEVRSEEHTSELQSLMRISYAVFCCQKEQ